MQDHNSLAEQSKVWIYQADRELSKEEVMIVEPLLADFIENWTSHNQELKAFGGLYHQRFIVLMVDESNAGASGCSIDKSVHFMEFLGQRLQLDFFNRMNFAYMVNSEVRTVRMDELPAAFESAEVKEDTLMFDNLVKTKEEFVKSWLKPLKESWHHQFID